MDPKGKVLLAVERLAERVNPSSVSYYNGVVQYNAADGEANWLQVTYDAEQGLLTVDDAGGITIHFGGTPFTGTGNQGDPVYLLGYQVTAVSAWLRDLADFAEMLGDSSTISAQFYGEDAADELHGGYGSDFLDGGNDADLLVGGP